MPQLIDEVREMRNHHWAMFDSLIKAGIAAGEFREIDSEVLACMVKGYLNEYVIKTQKTGIFVSVLEATEPVLKIMLDGIILANNGGFTNE